jgi:hypothetical protein
VFRGRIAGPKQRFFYPLTLYILTNGDARTQALLRSQLLNAGLHLGCNEDFDAVSDPASDTSAYVRMGKRHKRLSLVH